VAPDVATKLVRIAHQSRALKGRGLDEGMSTRMLVYAGLLMSSGLGAHASCDMALTQALTDDPDMVRTLRDFVGAQFGPGGA
jgi:nitric oxide reductase NorQ protein